MEYLFSFIEYYPETTYSLDGFIELTDFCEVVSWAWVNDPLDKYPLDLPFAWALYSVPQRAGTLKFKGFNILANRSGGIMVFSIID